MNVHFQRAFDYMDQACAKADAAFAEAHRGFKESDSDATSIKTGQHQLRFTTKTWQGRWQLFTTFIGAGTRALFTGKTTLKFQAK